MNVLPLVEQQHRAQVSDSFVSELRARDQLQALELSKMRWVSEHMNVEQLRDVATPPDGVFLPERGSDVGTLAVDDGALFSLRFSSADLSDEVAKSSWCRHSHYKDSRQLELCNS